MIFIVIRVPGMINEIIRYVILRYHVLIRSKNVYIYIGIILINIISTYILIGKQGGNFFHHIDRCLNHLLLKKIYIYINIVVI